jgi:hypothetical protein
VRVTNETGTVQDDSNGLFTVGTFEVHSPHGGEAYRIDTDLIPIAWNGGGGGGNALIQLSRDGGTTWPETIGNPPCSDGRFDWLPTGTATGNARIKITCGSHIAMTGTFALIGSVSSYVPGSVQCTPTPFYRSIGWSCGGNPNGGFEVYWGCAGTWWLLDTAAPADRALTMTCSYPCQKAVSGGGISAVTPQARGGAPGELLADDHLLRVSSVLLVGPTGSQQRIAQSSPDFNLDSCPCPTDCAVNLTYPESFVSWCIGATKMITYDLSSGCTYSTVELSRDGGQTYYDMGGSPGGFAWSVTGPASTQCMIRVTGYGGLYPVTDTSPTFWIVGCGCPYVSVLSGGSMLRENTVLRGVGAV